MYHLKCNAVAALRNLPNVDVDLLYQGLHCFRMQVGTASEYDTN